MNSKITEKIEKIEKIFHISNISFKSYAIFFYIMFLISLANLVFIILEKHRYLFLSIIFVFACSILSLMCIVGQKEINKLK
jgi:hypothetical protein